MDLIPACTRGALKIERGMSGALELVATGDELKTIGGLLYPDAAKDLLVVCNTRGIKGNEGNVG